MVDVTLVLVFLSSIGHRFEYNTSPYFFSGLAEHTGTQKFDKVFFFWQGGGSGSHLVSWPGSLSMSPYKIKFQVIYSIKK